VRARVSTNDDDKFMEIMYIHTYVHTYIHTHMYIKVLFSYVHTPSLSLSVTHTQASRLCIIAGSYDRGELVGLFSRSHI
jgi:hypothetical protein